MRRGQVTVMVPSYNYAHYLAECVSSAATQADADVDVVIVDNGSTDDSVAVADKLVGEHRNVRLVSHPDNQGIITSFDRCRDEVRGEYAVLLCADDVLTPGSLARSVALMVGHPGVGLVYGPAIDFVDLAGVDPQQYDTPSASPIVYPGARWIGRLCRAGTNAVWNPAALMRTSVIEEVGRFEPTCVHTSDLNMWLRIASRADVAYLRGPAQALFRLHPASFSRSFLAPGLGRLDIEQRWQAFSRFFETLGDHPERSDWDRRARRAIAGEARYIATRAYLRSPTVPEDDVDELLKFATSIDPGGQSKFEAWGWELRHRLGPGRSRRFPGFLVRPALRHLGRDVAHRRRLRAGV